MDKYDMRELFKYNLIEPKPILLQLIVYLMRLLDIHHQKQTKPTSYNECCSREGLWILKVIDIRRILFQ